METHIRVDRRFAILDEHVLDADVSDRAIRLYAVLMRYADKDTHKAFPSRKTLATRLRCSPASVDRASAELVEAGLMSKQQRHNNSLIYTLVTSSPVTTPIITGDETLSSPVTTPIITGDDLTRTIELEPKNDSLKRKKIASPNQFSLDEEFRREVVAKFPTLNIDTELESFRDYHISKDSKFKDWNAAFRTWCRNAVKWQSPAQARAQAPARGPGKREWVRLEHERGDHWACRPGEFEGGCK